MDLKDYTAGAYEERYEYKAFVPNIVNHAWVIADAELMDLLGRADRALGSLNAFSQLLPDINFFIQMHVAKEATQSSKLEGTQTDIEDAFKDIEDLNPEERDDWAEVQNYISAITEAIKNLDKLPLSNRLLCETHATLMQGVRGMNKQPGDFRSSQNWIGVSLKNAVFVPPHEERLPELMGDLEKFINDQQHSVHPLVKIAIAHYQFETIHPFLDGNGRLGRLMISLYLASEGLLAHPALYLSDYFERNKTSYIDSLMAVREGDHLREWLVFFIYGIEETAKASAKVFRAIIEMKQRIDSEVIPRFSSRRQENVQTLVKHLYASPIIDVKKASELLDTTPNTASSLIQDLVKHSVLSPLTGQRRNRLFIFAEYVNLFK